MSNTFKNVAKNSCFICQGVNNWAYTSIYIFVFILFYSKVSLVYMN